MATTCQTYPQTNTCHRFAYQFLENVKMYKYAKFDQNIWCNSRIMSIFIKKTSTDQNERCSAKPHHHFAYQRLDNVKIHK